MKTQVTATLTVVFETDNDSQEDHDAAVERSIDALDTAIRFRVFGEGFSPLDTEVDTWTLSVRKAS